MWWFLVGWFSGDCRASPRARPRWFLVGWFSGLVVVWVGLDSRGPALLMPACVGVMGGGQEIR